MKENNLKKTATKSFYIKLSKFTLVYMTIVNIREVKTNHLQQRNAGFNECLKLCTLSHKFYFYEQRCNLCLSFYSKTLSPFLKDALLQFFGNNKCCYVDKKNHRVSKSSLFNQ